MDDKEIDGLIESSSFIDDSLKEECKKYLKQIPNELDERFYSNKIPGHPYQGDIVDNFEVIYYEVDENTLNVKSLDNCPFILLSHTCDMYIEGKSRQKYVSVAPIFNFEEFKKIDFVGYSKEQKIDFLNSVKANRISDILYIPAKAPLDNSVVLLDRIFSVDPDFFRIKLERKETNRILSLSQLGFLFFLIKLTYHFARYEDRNEIDRR